jgi:putative hydrolase of the HAD superfamily
MYAPERIQKEKRMLRAITFDCWGTLVDARHTLMSPRVAYLREHLPGRDPVHVATAYEESLAQFTQVEKLGFSLSVPSVLSLTLDTLGTTLLPCDFDAVVRHWEEVILSDPPALLEGVPEVLATLQSRGLLLAVISDTGLSPGRVMRQLFAGYGILPYFEVLAFSNEVGVTKRRLQPFRGVLAALGVLPEQALHVGDVPDTDLRGAHQAGLRAALLLQNARRPEGIPLADLVLEHITELPAAVQGL